MDLNRAVPTPRNYFGPAKGGIFEGDSEEGAVSFQIRYDTKNNKPRVIEGEIRIE